MTTEVFPQLVLAVLPAAGSVRIARRLAAEACSRVRSPAGALTEELLRSALRLAATYAERHRQRGPARPGAPGTGSDTGQHGQDRQLEAIAGLGELVGEAVVLHEVLHLPVETIADLTAEPVAAVASRLSRGRRAIAASGAGPLDADAMVEHLRSQVAAPTPAELRRRRRSRGWRRSGVAAACLAVPAALVAAALIVPGLVRASGTAAPPAPVPSSVPTAWAPSSWTSPPASSPEATGDAAATNPDAGAAASDAATAPWETVELVDPDATSYIAGFRFAGPRRAAAVQVVCSDQRCRPDIAVWDGADWTVHSGPLQPFPEAEPVLVIAIPLPGTNLVLATMGSDGASWWFSDDDGETWTADTEEQGTVDRIADGAGVLLQCDPPMTMVCNAASLLVIDPGTGHAATLSGYPQLEGTGHAPFQDRKGRWWTSGVTEGGEPAVAVSTDAGRAWSTRTVGAAAGGAAASGDDGPTTTLTVLGRQLWLFVNARTDGQDSPSSLRAVYFSDDAGRSFARAWQRSDDGPPLSAGQGLPAGRSGVVLLCGNAGTGITLDTSGTLSPPQGADSCPPFASISYGPGGYVTAIEGASFYQSADGRTWTQHQGPPS